MAADPQSAGIFYADGHVRVYHGRLTQWPRHYVARERLCLRGTTDYWINALDGQPFFLVSREVDPGLLAMLREELVPRLQQMVPQGAPAPSEPFTPRFTLVFDREAYRPEFFREMKEQQKIAILTYHKYPGEPWREAEFAKREVELVGGERIQMPLAERGIQLSNGLWLREIRKRSDGGHQTSILSTDFHADSTRLAASMFARWCQENFYKYMREHYNLDRLVEYGTEAVPDTTRVVHPRWRELDAQIRSLNGRRQRQLALFGELQLEGELEEGRVQRYQQQKGELQENIAHLDQHIDQLKIQRKQTAHHLTLQQLPEPDRFARLRTERKHFVDPLKLIAYRAETSMAQIVREKLSRGDDARALLPQVYRTEVDLKPNLKENTLTVRLHHLTQAAHDEAVRHLCQELTETETLFPGTELKLIYKLGSS